MSESPALLRHWILRFAAMVIGILAVLNTVAALCWPYDWPLSVWDVVVALSASAVVALVAGIVTIAISWETSQHFGQQSSREIAQQFQDALASTLGDVEDFLKCARDFLSFAGETPGSLVLLAIADQGIFREHQLGERVAELLSERIGQNLPTVLVLPEADSFTGQIWSSLAQIPKRNTQFREIFTRRSSFVLSVPTAFDSLLVVLVPQDQARLKVAKSALAFGVSKASEVAGIRSEVDRAFGQMVLERFCALIQEPRFPYSMEVLSAADVLERHYSGVPVTRSIITSQLLQIAETTLDLQNPSEDFAIKALSPADPKKTIQFICSTKCFCPPLHAVNDHSGAVIARLLSSGRLEVTGRTVWEVGCGPGYVTMVLAEAVDSSGRVIATDVSDDASRIVRKNVELIGLEERVVIQSGDCGAFSLSQATDHDRTRLVSPSGESELIDYVFIELPLLPFCGDRDLSDIEKGYFESVPSEYDSRLPPAVKGLLGAISHGAGCQLHVVLPVAGEESADVDLVIQEAQELMGARWNVEELTDAAHGFIRVFLIRTA